MDRSTSGFLVYHPFLELAQYSCPLNQWCYLTISFSVISFLLPRLVLPSIRVFSSKSLLCVRWPKHWNFCVSTSFSKKYSGLVSFRMDWLDLLAVQGTLRCPLQDQSPTGSILRPSVSLRATLTSIHEYWRNHSFDWMDLSRQSNTSAFSYTVLVGHSFSSKEQASFNFMAEVTVHSDFKAHENDVCHCFHCFPV